VSTLKYSQIYYAFDNMDCKRANNLPLETWELENYENISLGNDYYFYFYNFNIEMGYYLIQNKLILWGIPQSLFKIDRIQSNVCF
jgi:hypothetical protein